MNRRFRFLALCLLPLLVAGCASPDSRPEGLLTYETKPEGATIYEGGVALGTTPVTRTYRGEAQASEITTPQVTAVWASGAKAVFWTRLKPRADEVAVISRPANAPGMDLDLAAEAKVVAARQKGERDKAEQLRQDAARNSPECRRQMQQGPAAQTLNACK